MGLAIFLAAPWQTQTTTAIVYRHIYDVELALCKSPRCEPPFHGQGCFKDRVSKKYMKGVFKCTICKHSREIQDGGVIIFQDLENSCYNFADSEQTVRLSRFRLPFNVQV